MRVYACAYLSFRWNRTLMRQRGVALGAEFKGKGGELTSMGTWNI